MATVAFLIPRSLNLLSLNDMQLARQICFNDVFYWFWEESDYLNPELIIEDVNLALPLADYLWVHQLTPYILNLATKSRWIHCNLPCDSNLMVPDNINITFSGNFDSCPSILNTDSNTNVIKLYSQIQSNQLKLFIKLFLTY